MTKLSLPSSLLPPHHPLPSLASLLTSLARRLGGLGLTAARGLVAPLQELLAFLLLWPGPVLVLLLLLLLNLELNLALRSLHQ